MPVVPAHFVPQIFALSDSPNSAIIPPGIAGLHREKRMESYLYNMNQSAEATGGHTPPAHKPTEAATVSHDELRRGIAATRQFFFNHQHPDGYWVSGRNRCLTCHLPSCLSCFLCSFLSCISRNQRSLSCLICSTLS